MTKKNAAVIADPASDALAVAMARWPRWPRRAGIAALVLLYIGLWGGTGLLTLNPTDLDVFFLPAARVVLAGHPLLAYQVRYAVNYPNANGPLSLVPLTAAAALAAHQGWLNDPALRRMVVMAVFALFPLLMSYEAIRAVNRVRGVPLRGIGQLLAYGALALSPQLWHGMLLYGHIEQPIALWLVLLGVRMLVEQRPGRAGICLGLALLTRSSVLVFFLPLLVLLLRHRRWRASTWLSGATALTLGLGLLPFWLADRGDLIYSLVTFRGQLAVGGGSVWGIALGTPLGAFAQHNDSTVVLAAALLVTVLTLLVRPDLDFGSRDLYALLAITAFCFPLFIKTLWPYYFLEPYVFITLWWLAGAPRAGERARWRWRAGLALPLAVLGSAQMAEQGIAVVYSRDFIRAWSLAMTLAMLLMMVALTGALVSGRRRQRALVTAETLQAGYNA
ncbi:MAG: hypothetical protein IVW57_12520 [Ktedonobacterales bacterium]|nr:hypothetical protein [Ktedonobacterales bacterium]